MNNFNISIIHMENVGTIVNNYYQINESDKAEKHLDARFTTSKQKKAKKETLPKPPSVILLSYKKNNRSI